jgi:hypothetical protein
MPALVDYDVASCPGSYKSVGRGVKTEVAGAGLAVILIGTVSSGCWSLYASLAKMEQKEVQSSVCAMPKLTEADKKP